MTTQVKSKPLSESGMHSPLYPLFPLAQRKGVQKLTQNQFCLMCGKALFGLANVQKKIIMEEILQFTIRMQAVEGNKIIMAVDVVNLMR